MAARTIAAPPTPWSKDLAEPQIDESAYVHSFSNLIGDVKVGPNVLIAPGTSIRADEGTPFYIGESTNIQDGVVIHGLEKGRVVGDDGKEYSVWIGNKSCITHMALIHGPAYVGDECFIGFRSTVFNARVGNGCIVMMHALIQDVEIPPGKYVASGAVITNQQQADRLPDIQPSDRAFASHVVEINEALRLGYQCAENQACITPIREGGHKAPPLQDGREKGINETQYKNSVETMTVTTDIRGQIRSLLNQGYKIGAEHADKRRFKTSSWLSCGTVSATREDQVLAELNGWCSEYQGEYIRLIGIDTAAKRRVLEMVIQRPEDGAIAISGAATSNGSAKVASSNGNGKSQGDVSGQVRSLLRQGYKIGTEYANQRRFKTSSWLTGPAIESKQETAVIRELESILADHEGEYVRLVAIDPAAKKRVLETVIQRPDGAVSVSSGGTAVAAPSLTKASSGGLSDEVISQIRSILNQGLTIGTEHADKRRFRTKSWQSCSPITSKRESEVLASLGACLADHQGEYVRLIGIDPSAKRRVIEVIIQRPEDQPISNGSAVAVAAAPSSSSGKKTTKRATAKISSNLDANIVHQVRSILNQGLNIGTEHADARRFRTKSWQSCSPIASKNESEVLGALEACLAEHQGEYVRLIGIDTHAKRRVIESIIQRP